MCSALFLSPASGHTITSLPSSGAALAILIHHLHPRHEGGANNPTPRHEAAIWQKQHGATVKSDNLPTGPAPRRSYKLIE